MKKHYIIFGLNATEYITGLFIRQSLSFVWQQRKRHALLQKYTYPRNTLFASSVLLYLRMSVPLSLPYTCIIWFVIFCVLSSSNLVSIRVSVVCLCIILESPFVIFVSSQISSKDFYILVTAYKIQRFI